LIENLHYYKMENRWIKIRGTANSPAWKKGKVVIEVFQDTSWRTNEANVIIYDSTKPTYESSLGKVIDTKYFDTKKEAMKFAQNYMRTH